jgi:hypothetical protein
MLFAVPSGISTKPGDNSVEKPHRGGAETNQTPHFFALPEKEAKSINR